MGQHGPSRKVCQQLIGPEAPGLPDAMTTQPTRGTWQKPEKHSEKLRRMSFSQAHSKAR